MLNSLKNVGVRLFNVSPIPAHKVFTPASAAEVNYVARPELENNIIEEIQTVGKQILLYGHSGSGKTTIIRSIIHQLGRKYIRTHCEKATTFNDIILDGFDNLDRYVISEKSISEKSSITSSLSLEIQMIKSQIAASSEMSAGVRCTRILPPQLTPQRLAKMIGESELVWIIEDFHKVDDAEKKRIADLLKFFCDNANDYSQSKIVCIGACESANELVALEPNLKGRVSEIHVSLLSDKDIKAIAKNGFKLLNINAHEELIEQIVYYSARLGSMAHQMCLDICRGIGVNRRVWKEKNIDRKSFNHAIKGLIKKNEGTLTSIYESAVKDELGWYILKTLSNNKHDKLPLREIYKIISRSKCQPTMEEIEEKLIELSTPEYGVVFCNSRTGFYSIATPFWGAFLRMQFALEASKDKANKPHKLELRDQNDKEAIVEHMMLELLKRYHQLYVTEGSK